MTEAKGPGWLGDVRTMTPEATELFEVYAKVPTDKVKEHIKQIVSNPIPCESIRPSINNYIF